MNQLLVWVNPHDREDPPIIIAASRTEERMEKLMTDLLHASETFLTRAASLLLGTPIGKTSELLEGLSQGYEQVMPWLSKEEELAILSTPEGLRVFDAPDELYDALLQKNDATGSE